jgi:hypothetical protein
LPREGRSRVGESGEVQGREVPGMWMGWERYRVGRLGGGGGGGREW